MYEVAALRFITWERNSAGRVIHNAGGSSQLSEDLSIAHLQRLGHTVLLTEGQMVADFWSNPADGLLQAEDDHIVALSVTRIRGAYDILARSRLEVQTQIESKLRGLVRSAQNSCWRQPVTRGVLHIWIPYPRFLWDILSLDLVSMVASLPASSLQEIQILPILVNPDHPAIIESCRC